MFCVYLRTNSDLCHLQHKLIGFYNWDEKCLQRGTDWVFKYSGLRFVFKGLNILQIKEQDSDNQHLTDCPQVKERWKEEKENLTGENADLKKPE